VRIKLLKFLLVFVHLLIKNLISHGGGSRVWLIVDLDREASGSSRLTVHLLEIFLDLFVCLAEVFFGYRFS